MAILDSNTSHLCASLESEGFVRGYKIEDLVDLGKKEGSLSHKSEAKKKY